MKNSYIQILDNGTDVRYVSSFSADGESIAFVVTPNKDDALPMTFVHAFGVSALLGAYGNAAQPMRF